jgi:nucleotide-binding universal stress UspA family protein
LQIQILAGQPVRAIIELSRELKADLLITGAQGHSTFYERMIGNRADRIIQLAPCPVLVVK